MAIQAPSKPVVPVPVNRVAMRHLNCLIYGNSGVGKTVFASTGPRPTLYINVDKGTLSIADLQDDVLELSCNTWTDIKDIILFLRAEFEKNPNAYRVIVLDNVTELQRILMQSITEGKSIATTQDWGILLNYMRFVVRRIRELPCHTVFIFHEQVKDGMFAPMLDGKLYKEITGMFDVVARYVLIDQQVTNSETGQIDTKTIRYLRCIATQDTTAKDRSWKLAKAEPVDLNKLIAKATTPKQPVATVISAASTVALQPKASQSATQSKATIAVA